MNQFRLFVLISLFTFLLSNWVTLRSASAEDGVFIDSNQSLGTLDSSGVALGDVDGDGDLDAFIANGAWLAGGQANKVWLNNGGGSFSDSGQSLGSSGSFVVALGDLDSDNDLDAFIANHPGSNRVWLNDGNGNFTDSGQALGNSCFSVALGDLDNDGDLDAFIITGSQPSKVWLNDGSGKFTDSGQSLGASIIYRWDVALGDVDGDGDLDGFIAVGHFQGSGNEVWLNNGAGVFADSGQSLGNSVSRGVALGDMDGDGDLDAFIANNPQSNKVWLNDGNGVFADNGQNYGTISSSNSYDVALGDVDGDGDFDAFIANLMLPNKVWLNDGNGDFVDSGQHLGISDSEGIALADMDSDNDLDAFIANRDANKVYFNTETFPTDYDATGGWKYSTTNNWVDPGPQGGCVVQTNQTGNATVTQTGNKVTITGYGSTFRGDVKGAVYTVSSSFSEGGGTVTVIFTITLTASTSGSGTIYWYWTDGSDTCFGGSDISFTKGTGGSGSASGGGGGGG